jgi:5-methylcytosine-specific restriction endonuclease McrA
VASRYVCAHCKRTYRRSKNRMYGRSFCSLRCYFSGRKVSVFEIWRRDRAICHLCKEYCPLPEASRDHVVPRFNNGPTTFGNIRLAHKSCNSRRGHKSIDEFLDILDREEFERDNKRHMGRGD